MYDQFRDFFWVLHSEGISYKSSISDNWREVSLSNKPDELIMVSPKGTVPVLITSNGLVLEQASINEYAPSPKRQKLREALNFYKKIVILGIVILTGAGFLWG